MKSRTMMVGLTLLSAMAVLGLGAPVRAQAAPSVTAGKTVPTSSVELGLQGTVVGGGGDVQGTFLGAVFTLQGASYAPVAGVFQFGVGAGLDEDPEDPNATRTGDQLFMALGTRVRPLRFGRKGDPGLVDLYVGPLVGVLASHEIVTLTVGAEVGVALRFGHRRRLRLSLTAHGGWARVLHQDVPERLDANWHAGGQLSFGFGF